MSTKSTYEDATHEVDGEEPIEVGDLLDDPRTDAEALCLCALLWSPADTASDVSDLLRSTDFERGVYGELFEVITALTQAGKTTGHRGTQLARALTQAVMAGSPPQAVGHYAVTVASAAYRRSFHTAAAALTQAAEQLPQDQLFEHMVSIGRAQRAATERLDTLTRGLSDRPVTN